MYKMAKNAGITALFQWGNDKLADDESEAMTKSW